MPHAVGHGGWIDAQPVTAQAVGVVEAVRGPLLCGNGMSFCISPSAGIKAAAVPLPIGFDIPVLAGAMALTLRRGDVCGREYFEQYKR